VVHDFRVTNAELHVFMRMFPQMGPLTRSVYTKTLNCQ